MGYRLMMITVLMMMGALAMAVQGNEYEYDESLSYSYYHTSCPQLESIIHKKLDQWLKNDSTLAPSLINLHFHDCVVRGCDASVLLDHKGSERTADASKSLRGFEVINDIKSEVEKTCPRTVSCADILTAAARDATVKSGGPFWMIPYGRKDGKISLADEAQKSVPTGHERVTDLIELFQSKGLNILDLVVLSGAHTIGKASCGCLQNRLFDYIQHGKPDPSINPRYLNFLRRKCRWASERVELDPITPNGFDVQYYKNLQSKMGLLSTDQLLYTDSRTGPLVSAFASQPEQFHHQFAASMLRLGKIQDCFGDEHSEIRLKCNVVNAK
ncbi:peroxidase 7 [Phtheirospermum japonicum]|uniref:Peroxidase n=1 Tax=Phtheirospermum japonicum TaxID=374723 RepID=A0A830CXG5_9LAMI|nr:peroxidase 7 [Phtheirospermum japonicum]